MKCKILFHLIPKNGTHSYHFFIPKSANFTSIFIHPISTKNVPFISSLHPTNARILRLLCMKIRRKIRTNERILRQYSFISFQQKNVPLISFLHPKNARILRLYSFISFQQKNVLFISFLHPTNVRIIRLY